MNIFGLADKRYNTVNLNKVTIQLFKFDIGIQNLQNCTSAAMHNFANKHWGTGR